MPLTPEQHALRRTGITASELAVVVGVSRWSSPVKVYASKIGEPLEDESNLRMELGDLLEEPIAALYSRLQGLRLARCTTLRHPRHHWLLATPDRLALRPEGVTPPTQREIVRECDRVVQVKTTGWRQAHEWGEPGTDQVPDEVVVQVHAEMAVTGLERADVPVLFDRDRFEIYVVHWNDELWAELLEAAERFWFDHVEARRPPAVDASDEYGDFLERHFGSSYTSKKRPLVKPAPGSEVEALVRRFALVDLVDKALGKAKKLLANQVKEAIGTERGLILDELGNVQWIRSPPKEGKVDQAAVAAELEAHLRRLLAALTADRDGSEADAAAAEIRKALETLEARHRKPGSGYSALRGTWSAEAKKQAAAMLAPLELPALSDGSGNTEESDEVQPKGEQHGG